jgi:uncharacterized membrane protein
LFVVGIGLAFVCAIVATTPTASDVAIVAGLTIAGCGVWIGAER